MKSVKKLAIVGRTNVGKSTLFNRLSSEVKSIALDYEGVTRDFLKEVISWNGRTFELIDTGGIELKKRTDEIAEKIRLTALATLDRSDLILFLVDGTTGPLPEDLEIGKYMHKTNKPVILLINKMDVSVAQERVHEFYQLGFSHTIGISAQHSLGMSDLLTAIEEEIPAAPVTVDEPGYKVALLGKPNVGKSSLMNLLVEYERSMVSDIPGTTREAISDQINFYQEIIQLTDTAGVRRSRSVTENLEELMVRSSFQAVRDADIVLLMIDGHEAALSHQELKLASFIFDNGKAIIIVRNKSDLMEEQHEEKWDFMTEPYEHILRKVEMIKISCKTGYNVGKIMPLIKEVWARYQNGLTTTELTTLFKDALQAKPLYKSQQRLKVFSARQVAVKPPTIRLNVNEPQWFETSQLGFFEGILRKKYDLRGVPIKFLVRKMRPR